MRSHTRNVLKPLLASEMGTIRFHLVSISGNCKYRKLLAEVHRLFRAAGYLALLTPLVFSRL